VTRLAERLEIQLTPDGRVLADGHDITTEIRSPAISNLTSPLSAIPGVRDRMSALQKDMGVHGGIVMEGRDIGTVVLPHAEVKVFLTASQFARAYRRHEELKKQGIVTVLETLAREISERDERDASRDASPMFPASDARIINTDALSAEEVVAQILELYQEAQRRVSV
jgi:cytidylate kinase